MIGLLYLGLLVLYAVYTYGFVDPNLQLSTNPLYTRIHEFLYQAIFLSRPQAAAAYVVFIVCFFAFYIFVLRAKDIRRYILMNLRTFIFATCLLFALSFPAYSYDVFNYMLTAKVAFYYHENPYIVKPIEIPNEPALAYTRASNKVALYGPTWIMATAFPFVLGGRSVWMTLLSFKLLNVILFLATLFMIYRVTKSEKCVIFFAFNPLILNEVLNGSHNDVFMILLAAAGLVLHIPRRFRSRLLGASLWLVSVLAKGATIILIPLFFIKNISSDRLFRLAYWLMFAIFLVTPLREELYPWYAIWFLTFAALIPWKKHSFIHEFSIAVSLGLELRHLPYIYTREYGGMGPALRIVFTSVPIVCYGCWFVKKYGFKEIIPAMLNG